MKEVNGSRKEGRTNPVSPGGHTGYGTLGDSIGEEGQTSPQHGLPLFRSEENHERVKCYRCRHRRVASDGIYCRKYRRYVIREMAETCQRFAPRGRSKKVV